MFLVLALQKLEDRLDQGATRQKIIDIAGRAPIVGDQYAAAVSLNLARR
jgi:hypothetical protein